MSVDLSTTYLGFDLKNPIVASASPMTARLDSLRELEEAGVAAVVLPSVFEEQIEHEAMEMQRLMEQGAGTFAEALSGYFPEFDDYATRTEAYLRHVTQAKEALSVPVIGSLNGTTNGGWVNYAKRIQEAGADALELNVYLIPTNPETTGPEIEDQYLDLVWEVRQQVSIPLAVKVGPYFSSTPNMAVRLAEAGADALVLFNRFYQPDIDLESLEIVPKVNLSTSVGAHAAAAMDRSPVWSRRRRSCHHLGCSHLRGRAQVTAGRIEGGHDGVCAAQEGPRAGHGDHR